uniref:Uncharacterized protein n=1 Tax=Rhizophora mucronata TaxID=61149 RepID=A0A2P2R470_RHIMU
MKLYLKATDKEIDLVLSSLILYASFPHLVTTSHRAKQRIYLIHKK